MTFSAMRRYAIVVLLSTPMAGCAAAGFSAGGGSPQLSSPAQGGVLRLPSSAVGGFGDASTTRGLFVSTFDGPNGTGEVVVFPAGLNQHNPSPLRTITNGTQRPLGVWVDHGGTLYVANLPDAAPTTGVSEYRHGQQFPFRVLTDRLIYPTAVAVGADGTVYVNDRMNSQGQVGDFVTVFPPGQTHASRTITVEQGGREASAGELAIDGKGNVLALCDLFFDGLSIYSINPTTFAVTKMPLNLKGLVGPGIAVDGAGNLYVSSYSTAQIAVFAPGSQNPTRIIGQGAYDITVTRDGTLYAGTYYGVDEYKPGANSPSNSVQLLGAFGVAVGPAY
jgi:hypothetical protein